MKFYSASANGFFDDEINAAIPEDAIEISEEYYAELFAGQASGKIIVADDTGYPRIEDRPAPTPEEQIQINNAKARQYLAETDWYVIRRTETGDEIPQEILDRRAAARLSIVG